MSVGSRLNTLLEQAPVVLPSLLLCDFGNLEREIDRLEKADTKALHLDIMDGDFVPNLTYGLPIVKALRRLTDLPLDTHLMISRPERYIDAFHQAGADMITVHIEATDDPSAVLRQIRRLGICAGIALNPKTPLSAVEHLVTDCDLVLMMSVEPGFGGQTFDPTVLKKLKMARELFGDRTVLEVDGGVNEETITECTRAGAQLMVAGSAIFGRPDYKSAMEVLRTKALQA
ncbi:MAG: ribulose-phosphate 3-epimerase [Planctomycetaceae bacterium]|nr:ribulose-phosphate 3-epimerase [Planctomycetaceae bacterium]MBP62716.1 ribulose-phosphate 3-epimerase [Planctomycetaceae bacterium]